MKKILVIFVISIVVLFSSCIVIIGELIPKKPTASVKLKDIAKIQVNELLPESDVGFEVFYVKGYKEPHTPDLVEPKKRLKEFLLETHGSYDLNRSVIFRFFNKTKKADKIVILVTGIYSGAGTVSNLALSIVRRLSDSEVWIWERRANLLEDRRVFIKALKERKSSIILEKFEKDKFKLKENSFYQPLTEDISFVGYWGVNVLLTDLLNVVKEAKNRASQVMLAGYSLGVLYVTNFLASKFNIDDKEVFGYSLVDKTVLLDGPPMINGYIKSEYQYQTGVIILPYNVIEGKSKLESGKYYPCNATVSRDMSFFFVINSKATLAYLAPNELSIEPYKVNNNYLPITNLAKFLIEFDDNYQRFKLFTATFGRAEAEHTGKFSPSTVVKVKSLAQDKKVIQWRPFSEFEGIEFNNHIEYLKAECNEYFNMEEWYQPTRILLDFGSIHHNDTSRGWQKKYFNITGNIGIKVPFLCVGLSRGLTSQINSYLEYKRKISSNDFTIVMLDEITHLDGDTITDNGSRPVIADIVANWLYNKNIYIQK